MDEPKIIAKAPRGNIFSVGNGGVAKNNTLSVDNSVINIYNIVLENTALCNSMRGESSKLAYQRNILESISRITTDLKGIHGIVKGKKFDRRCRKNVLYIGNVFWDDLYLSNHLVVAIDDKSLESLEIGMYIRFNATIKSYRSNTPEHYMKYGLSDIKVVFKLKTTLNYLPFELKYTDVEKVEFNYDKINQRTLQMIINRIQWLTLYKTEFPQNFFINMVLNLHFAEYYEKILFTHQNDYNFLKENVHSIIYPMCNLMYILDTQGYIDPYTVLSYVCHMYKEKMLESADIITIETGIQQRDITNFINKCVPYIDRLINLDDIYNDSEKYIHEKLQSLTENIVVE